jgi:hypothetical protein
VQRGKSVHKAKTDVSASAINPQFYLYLYESCFDANGVGANGHVVGNLRDATGRMISNFEGDADVDGYLYECFDGNTAFNDVLPGYRVTFKVFNSSGAYQGAYAAVTPAVNITAFNKANSTMSGNGPAGKAYDAYWYHPNLNSTNTHLWKTVTGTISAAKTWSVDFGSVPFRGYDDLYLDAAAYPNFTFERWLTVPFTYCDLGQNYCGGYGIPGQAATLSIKHAGVMYNFSGKFNNYGWFGTSLQNAAGYPIFLAVGDTVTGTGVPAWALTNMTAAINYTTDVVSGKAPASKWMSIGIKQPYSNNFYWKWMGTNAASNYAVNFHASMDLKITSAYTVSIEYINPATGNYQYFTSSFAP